MTGRRFGAWGLGVGAGFLASWAFAWGVGLRINTSSSVPVGLWRESTLHRDIKRGDVVAVCPEDTEVFRTARARGYLSAGWCDGNLDEVMFKPVAAVAGDVVTVSAQGIAVNGVPIQHAAALKVDTLGQPLSAIEAGTYIVGVGTIWLISDYNARSFDSRYFGSIRIAHVRGVVTPLAVFRCAKDSERGSCDQVPTDLLNIKDAP